jgi:hypothetical protein
LSILFVILTVAAFIAWYLQRQNEKPTFSNVSIDDKNSETIDFPTFQYSVFSIDVKHQQKIKLNEIIDYPNQFGIVNGQAIEFNWHAINADFIEISGLGIVNSIGSNTYFPSEKFSIQITIKNKKHTVQKKIDIHLYPVPIIEKLKIPMPEINLPNLNFQQQLPSFELNFKPASFPNFEIPSITSIQDHTFVQKPKTLDLIKIESKQTIDFFQLKNNVWNKLKNRFSTDDYIQQKIDSIKNQYQQNGK